MLHGGFWRARYGKWIMRALADDLAGRGYAAWNLEYRRVGPLAGGGYPNTLDDVAAGIDYLALLAQDQPLDLSRVAVIGHSAGGHLALWAAGRVAEGRVEPTVFVSLAGVTDLRSAYDMGLGAGAVHAFMGGPPDDARDDSYRQASPIERLPYEPPAKVVLVHGRADANVPVDQSRALAAADDEIELVELECDHMALIDPRHEAWQMVVDRLP